MYVFHYFTLYGRRLGLRYCSLSIFHPNSEVLRETIQKDILSLLIEFPIEQVIREFPVSDITYLSSNMKGQGVRYPDLGSMPPWGWRYPGLGSLTPTPGNLANSNLKSYLIILNLQFQCTDIRMVVVPALTYFFTLWKGIGANKLWPKKFPPKLRKSCKQN